MNQDQLKRLLKAAVNLGELVEDVEWLIDLMSGTAGKLEAGEELVDMPKKLKVVELPTNQIEQLKRWRELSDQLADIKNEESQLRMLLVTQNFTAEKLEGTESIDIGWGWRLKAVKDLNITATNESHQTEKLLEALNGYDPAMAQGLVKWKPEVSNKVYREMLALCEEHPELKSLMAAAITVKPGMPQLEMVAPKEEIKVDTNVPIPVYQAPTEDGGTLTSAGDSNFEY